LSFGELEKDWQHDLKRKLTWYTYVINNLYEFLFFFAAIIAVIGFLRAFMRKRAYMRQDDVERQLRRGLNWDEKDMQEDTVYQRLAEHLSCLGMGYPCREDLIDILKENFTEKELPWLWLSHL
jgi:hypothetical protein